MKKTPSQHEKGLYGYSLETLIKLRNDLEAAFIARNLAMGAFATIVFMGWTSSQFKF